MVGMNGDVVPVRDIVGLAIPGQQLRLLLFLKNDQGQLAGGAVDSLSGDLETPLSGLLAHIGDSVKLTAFEKSPFHVIDTVFHLGLVFRMTRPGRVGEKSPVLGVLQKAAGEPGIDRISSGHRSREIIDYQVLGDTTKQSPAGLHPFNYISQLLTKQGPDENMPGVSQDDDHAPDQPPAAAV